MIRAVLFGVVTAMGVLVALACTTTLTTDGGASSCPPSTTGATSCVLPMLAKAVSVHAPWDETLTAAGKACGVTKDQASALWASHTQAEVIEGFVPRSIGPIGSEGGI